MLENRVMRRFALKTKEVTGELEGTGLHKE
jgi:hypothetical protein